MGFFFGLNNRIGIIVQDKIYLMWDKFTIKEKQITEKSRHE